MTSVTANEIIYNAMRVGGILTGAGRTPSTEEYSDGLKALNAIVDAWATASLRIPTHTVTAAALPTGETSTVGPSAYFNTPAGIRIDQANVITGYGGANPGRHPVQVIQSWQEFAQRRDQATSTTIPAAIYLDDAYPTATLYYVPKATAGEYLEIYYWSALGTFASGATSVDLQPAYKAALEFNLAMDLHPRYPQATPLSQVVIQRAREYRADVERFNAARNVPTIRPEWARGGGQYDINSDRVVYR